MNLNNGLKSFERDILKLFQAKQQICCKYKDLNPRLSFRALAKSRLLASLDFAGLTRNPGKSKLKGYV